MIKGAAIFAVGAASGLIVGSVYGLVLGFRARDDFDKSGTDWKLTDEGIVREAR